MNHDDDHHRGGKQRGYDQLGDDDLAGLPKAVDSNLSHENPTIQILLLLLPLLPLLSAGKGAKSAAAAAASRILSVTQQRIPSDFRRFKLSSRTYSPLASIKNCFWTLNKDTEKSWVSLIQIK